MYAFNYFQLFNKIFAKEKKIFFVFLQYNKLQLNKTKIK